MIRARRTVERVEEYVPLPEGRLGMIRLDLNENVTSCHRGLLRALKRSMTPEWCAIYPEYENCQKTLARHFRVSTDELIITNGVDDAIMLICDTFVDPGDTLVIPSPTFAIYQFFHEVRAGKTRRVNYDAKVQLPVEKLIATGRGARWMALANPNNPTGTLISQGDLKMLLEALSGTVVLVDEAYFDFSGATILPWIRRFPNLVVSRTLSKAHGLAALRIGLMFANRKLAALMRRIHAAYAVNAVAAIGAVEAMNYPKPVERYAAMICRNRERFCRELTAMNIPYIPSAANFVLIRVGPCAQEIADRLKKQGILARAWNPDSQLRHCLRITIGTTPQMRRLMKALAGLQHLIEADRQNSGRDSSPRWFV